MCLLMFLISYNIYLYKEATIHMDSRILKLWNYYSLLFLLIGIFISERFMNNFYQKQFTIISWIILFVTITVIILTNHGYIQNPYYMLGIIDLGTLLVTGIILISGGRHGAFKN